MAIKFISKKKQPKRVVRTEQDELPATPTTNHQLNMQLVPLESVKLWPENPWNHQKIIPQLAKALAIHGQVSAVIVWRENNTIYKGNHTHRALTYLRDNIAKVAKELDTTISDIMEIVDPRYIKVEYRDFPSENAATAYGLSDNNLGQGGKYDDDLLLKIMQSDQSYFLDTNRTGFTEKDLKAFQLSAMSDISKLANTDIAGDSQQMGEFAIVLFDSVFELNAFKQAFGMAVNERKIHFSKIMATMSDEWHQWFIENIDDLPF
jgi:hypothetical protein